MIRRHTASALGIAAVAVGLTLAAPATAAAETNSGSASTGSAVTDEIKRQLATFRCVLGYTGSALLQPLPEDYRVCTGRIE